MAPVVEISTSPNGTLIPPHSPPNINGARFTMDLLWVMAVVVGHVARVPNSGKRMVVVPE